MSEGLQKLAVTDCALLAPAMTKTAMGVMTGLLSTAIVNLHRHHGDGLGAKMVAELVQSIGVIMGANIGTTPPLPADFSVRTVSFLSVRSPFR